MHGTSMLTPVCWNVNPTSTPNQLTTSPGPCLPRLRRLIRHHGHDGGVQRPGFRRHHLHGLPPRERLFPRPDPGSLLVRVGVGGVKDMEGAGKGRRGRLSCMCQENQLTEHFQRTIMRSTKPSLPDTADRHHLLLLAQQPHGCGGHAAAAHGAGGLCQEEWQHHRL